MVNRKTLRNLPKGGEPMNQTEKRLFLIQSLLAEQPRFRDLAIPSDESEQRQLLRSLFNVRLTHTAMI